MYNVTEKWEWLTTFYLKNMEHLVHVKEGAIFEFNNGVIEDQFVIGKGKSQGLEKTESAYFILCKLRFPKIS